MIYEHSRKSVLKYKTVKERIMKSKLTAKRITILQTAWHSLPPNQNSFVCGPPYWEVSSISSRQEKERATSSWNTQTPPLPPGTNHPSSIPSIAIDKKKQDGDWAGKQEQKHTSHTGPHTKPRIQWKKNSYSLVFYFISQMANWYRSLAHKLVS